MRGSDSFKSHGPNEINLDIIKDFRDILKVDLLNFFVVFHRNGKLTKGINGTFIALIPKVEIPQRLVVFCPISLVGCLYKILSEVLDNRLRNVVGNVVPESQSAFVKGRQILDCILIVNELVDDARSSKKGSLFLRMILRKRMIRLN